MIRINRLGNRAKNAVVRILSVASRHRIVTSLALAALLAGSSIAPLVGQQLKRGKTENERDSASIIRKRAEWFFHQRAYPLGYIPSGARARAFQQADEMRRTQGTFMDRYAAGHPSHKTIPVSQNGISLSNTTWTEIGPKPTSSSFFGLTSGRVNAIAIDPCDTTGNTVYIGAAQGGVWKTTNALSANPTWTPLTDNQPSLSTGSLVVDPVVGDCTGGHTGKIYFGTGEENFAFDSFYGAGVLLSTNGGSTWTKDNTFVTLSGGIINSQSPTAAGPYIGGLAVNQTTSGATQVLLAALEGISATAHSGIWRSTDAGADWTRVYPTNSQPQPYDYATSVAFDPNDTTGQTAYAALGIPYCASTCGSGEEADNGIYKSTDGGVTWTRLAGLDNAVQSEGLSTGSYGRITLTVGPCASSPCNPTHTELVVAVADIATESTQLLGSSSGLQGTFISTNGGSTFSPINAGPFCDFQCFYDISAGIDPANPAIIFLGGGPNAGGSSSPYAGYSSVIRSTDSGGTFGDVTIDGSTQVPIHVDNHAFAFDKPTSGANSGQTIVFIGDDGGVWSSSNVETVSAGSETWSDLNNSLGTTQFYPGNSIHPSNPEVAFSGAQDNGTQKFNPLFNPSNPLNWEDTSACGDGGWSAIDSLTPSTVYAACEAIGSIGTINKNQVDGEPGSSFENWFAIDTPAIDGDALNYSTDFVPPMILDGTDPNNLYFGTYRVWQSTNGGFAWNPISGDLTGVTQGVQGCGGISCVITTMAVSSDSTALYVGTDEGQVYVDPNVIAGNSSTFSEIDNSSMPGRTVTQIALSPTSNRTAIVTFSGFSGCGTSNGCDGLGHIFETTNGGGSWTNITGNLPDIPVNDIVIDPNDSTGDTLYIATDVGVFGTTDDGSTWSVLASGLPNIECTSLKLNNTARVLSVGTHGRGNWDLQLPFSTQQQTFSLTSISPVSANAGSGNLTLTLDGNGFPASPTVNFGGTTAAVTASSATEITATVPSSALADPAVVPVSVMGTSTSNSLNFSVEGPLPTITGSSPTTAVTGANVTVTVTGTNFNSTSQLLLISNTTGNAFTFSPETGTLTPTQFSSTVPASAIPNPDTFVVDVENQGPGGGPGFEPNTPFELVVSQGTGNSEFSFSTPSPQTQQVAPGSTTPAYTIPVVAQNGFAGQVQLTCGTLPAGASCTFNPNPVTPAASPGTNVSLTIATATSTPAGQYDVSITGTSGTATASTAVLLIVAAPGTNSFYLGVPNPQSQSITQGQTAQYSFLVGTIGTFSTPVQLNCTSLPSEAACGFSPNPVTPSSSGTNVTLSISTAAPSMVPLGPVGRNTPPNMWLLAALFVALAGIVLFAAAPKRRRLVLGSTLTLFLMLLVISGCSNSGSSSGSSNPGTPTGSYTITITGASGSTNIQQTVTLTVNP